MERLSTPLFFYKPFVQMVAKRLFLTGTERRWATCLDTATTQRFHEISDIQPWLDVFLGQQLSSRAQHRTPLADDSIG